MDRVNSGFFARHFLRDAIDCLGHILRLLLLSVVAVALFGCSKEKAIVLEGEARPPNILFILLDDLGFHDLGANGVNPSYTPKLDEFAGQSVRFTRNYVDSTCSATRAGIITGTTPAARGYRPSGQGISPEIITTPERLKQLGYTTHHIGKWHLGYHSRLAWPLAQGFDSFYGFLSQFLLRGPHYGGELLPSRPTYLNPWLQVDDEPPTQYRGHLSDLLKNRAIQFLSNASSEQPWFLNYWMYLPHTPMQPAARFAKRQPDTPKGRYRAMLAQMDDTVASILDALQHAGLAENTVVIIASDNGGTNGQLNNNAPFTGYKTTYQEGGVRTPLLVRWADGHNPGRVYDGVVSLLDYHTTIVALAGGQPVKNLRGRNLQQLLAEEEATLPADTAGALYWDSGNSQSSAWGILSADGRWRLSRFYVGEPVLNDLHLDATGTLDSLEEHPDIVTRLHREFLDWRHRERELQLNYSQDVKKGGALLTGDSLQRTPGIGGFTFAIQLDAISRPAVESGLGEEEVIALQPGIWSLVKRQEKLHLKIVGAHLVVDAPDLERCTNLVVTTQVVRSPLYPHENKVVVELYIDNELAASYAGKPHPLAEVDVTQATYLGRDEHGKRRYQGALGRPVILNERIRADADSDVWTENGISLVTQRFCSK